MKHHKKPSHKPRDISPNEQDKRFRHASAEARQLLHSGEAEKMSYQEFIDEVAYRAKVNSITANFTIFELVENKELVVESFNKKAKLAQGENLQKPDANLLSESSWNPIPTKVEGAPIVSDSSLVNTQRALVTQQTINHHLSAGSTIFIKDSSGNETELIFTREF